MIITDFGIEIKLGLQNWNYKIAITKLNYKNEITRFSRAYSRKLNGTKKKQAAILQ